VYMLPFDGELKLLITIIINRDMG